MPKSQLLVDPRETFYDVEALIECCDVDNGHLIKLFQQQAMQRDKMFNQLMSPTSFSRTFIGKVILEKMRGFPFPRSPETDIDELARVPVGRSKV